MTRVVGLLAAAAVVVVPGRPGAVAYALVWIGVVVAVAVDAVRVICRQPAERDARRRWYQRTPVLAVACGLVWAASIAWSMVIADTIVEDAHIRTAAMAPTILRGERLWLAPRRGDGVHRGNLVAYRLWDTPFVKRVVGVPGDTLAMKAGTLSVDGHLVVEPYAQHVGESEISDRRFDWQRAFVIASDRATYTPTLATWGPLVVPPANYFLLGDNRGETSDSRYNGFIPDSAVFGRPLTVYFSRDPIDGRIRWAGSGRRSGGSCSPSRVVTCDLEHTEQIAKGGKENDRTHAKGDEHGIERRRWGGGILDGERGRHEVRVLGHGPADEDQRHLCGCGQAREPKPASGERDDRGYGDCRRRRLQRQRGGSEYQRLRDAAGRPVCRGQGCGRRHEHRCCCCEGARTKVCLQIGVRLRVYRQIHGCQERKERQCEQTHDQRERRDPGRDECGNE